MTSGFSLMEMMVVLFIVAIIAAASAPMVSKKLSNAATPGDSKWMNIGLTGSIAFNPTGDGNRTAVIGSTTVPGLLGNRPRMYIETNDSNHPQLMLGFNGATDRARLLYNGTDGILALTTKNIIENCSTAFGFNADATNQYATAFGFNTSAALNATAIGSAATATKQYATAIGFDANATALNATAIGANTNAIAENATAIGAYSEAGKNSTAIGYGRTKADDGSFIANAIAIGYGAFAKATGAIAHGIGAIAKAESAIALGTGATAEMNATALGANATANTQSVAIGEGANYTSGSDNPGVGSVAIGYYARAFAPNAIALGYQTIVYGDHSIAIGDTAKVNKKVNGENSKNSIAIGNTAEVTGDNSIAIGYNTHVTRNNTIVIGNNAQITENFPKMNNYYYNDNSFIVIGNPSDPYHTHIHIYGRIYLHEGVQNNNGTMSGTYSDVNSDNIHKHFQLCNSQS